MMLCQHCKSPTRVVHTSNSASHKSELKKNPLKVYRRRKCQGDCGRTFTTVEKLRTTGE